MTQEMILTVRTQPQPTVLARYNDFFKEGFDRYRRQLDVDVGELGDVRTEVVEELEQLIRDMLADICKLAELFNPHHTATKYAANIMLYVALEQTTPTQRDRLSTEIKFRAANQGLDGLRGVLRLMPRLSCDNTSDENQPKRSLRPLSLPIPLEVRRPDKTGREHHWFVLPGGPRAYVSFQPSQVPDVRKLGEWCRDNTAFDPERISRIEAYMKEAADSKRFGSFYSLPLAASGWRTHRDQNANERAIDEPEYRPIGVINIESVDPGIFEMPDPSKDFFTFIGPLLVLVSEFVDMLVSLEPDYATHELSTSSRTNIA